MFVNTNMSNGVNATRRNVQAVISRMVWIIAKEDTRLITIVEFMSGIETKVGK